MKKKEAKKQLIELIGDGTELCKHKRNDIEDFADDIDDLVRWCSGVDDGKIVMDPDKIDDIEGFSITFYGVDCEDDSRCVSFILASCAFIVTTDKNKVFAYGTLPCSSVNFFV